MPISNKLIFYIFFLGVTCSCHERSGNESTISNSISFSIDTVYVDAKTEFLFLFGNLAGSSISRNKSLLCVFNRIEMALEVIDLDCLMLKKKIQFEIEGLYGTGPYISDFSIYNSDEVIFHTNNRYGHFDSKGKKIKSYQFDFGDSGLSEVEYLSRLFSWDKGKVNFGIISNSVSDLTYLAEIDLNSGEIKRVPLPEFKDLKDYAVSITRNGRTSGGFGPRVKISQSSNRMILSSDFSNKFFIYQLGSKELSFKTVESSIIPNQKELPEFNVAETMDQYYSFQQAYYEDINFLPPFWDERREVFLRFSYKEILGDLKNEYGKPIASNCKLSNDKTYSGMRSLFP